MIEVEVEAHSWTAALPNVKALVREAAESALKAAHPRESGDPGVSGSDRGATNFDVSCDREGEQRAWVPAFAGMSGNVVVLLTDDAAVHVLNRGYRDRDQATNVLSFPAAPSAAPHLGDIALAFETCAREAAEQGKSLEHHLQHLVAHGVLHLLGWDHMTEAEAEAMEGRERLILAGLGAPDPYRERDIPPHG